MLVETLVGKTVELLVGRLVGCWVVWLAEQTVASLVVRKGVLKAEQKVHLMVVR